MTNYMGATRDVTPKDINAALALIKLNWKLKLGVTERGTWKSYRSKWEAAAMKKYPQWDPVCWYGIVGATTAAVLKVKIGPTSYGHFLVKASGNDGFWLVLSENETADSEITLPPKPPPSQSSNRYYIDASSPVNRAVLQSLFEEIKQDPRIHPGSDNPAIWAAIRAYCDLLVPKPSTAFKVDSYMGKFGSPSLVVFKAKIGLSSYGHYLYQQEASEPYILVLLSDNETNTSSFLFPPNLQPLQSAASPVPGAASISSLDYLKSSPAITDAEYRSYMAASVDSKVAADIGANLSKAKEYRRYFEAAAGTPYARWNPLKFIGSFEEPRCVQVKVEVGPHQHGHFLAVKDKEKNKEVWCIVSEWMDRSNYFPIPGHYEEPASMVPSQRCVKSMPPISDQELDAMGNQARSGAALLDSEPDTGSLIESWKPKLLETAGKSYAMWNVNRSMASFGEPAAVLISVQTSAYFYSQFLVSIRKSRLTYTLLTDCAAKNSPFISPALDMPPPEGPPSSLCYASARPVDDKQLVSLFAKCDLYNDFCNVPPELKGLPESWRSEFERLAGKKYETWEPIRWKAVYGEPAVFLIIATINALYAGVFMAWAKKNVWSFAILSEYHHPKISFTLPSAIRPQEPGPPSGRYAKSSQALTEAQLQEYFDLIILNNSSMEIGANELPSWLGLRQPFEKVAGAPYPHWVPLRVKRLFGEPAGFCLEVEVNTSLWGHFMFFQRRGACIYTILTDSLKHVMPFQLPPASASASVSAAQPSAEASQPPAGRGATPGNPLEPEGWEPGQPWPYDYYLSSSPITNDTFWMRCHQATFNRSRCSFESQSQDYKDIINGWRVEFQKLDQITYPMWNVIIVSGSLTESPLNYLFKVQINTHRYIHCLVHAELGKYTYVISSYYESRDSFLTSGCSLRPHPAPMGISVRLSDEVPHKQLASLHEELNPTKEVQPEEREFFERWRAPIEAYRHKPYEKWVPTLRTVRWGEPYTTILKVLIEDNRYAEIIALYNTRRWCYIVVNEFMDRNSPFNYPLPEMTYSGTPSTKIVRSSRPISDSELNFLGRMPAGRPTRPCTAAEASWWEKWRPQFQVNTAAYTCYEPQKWVGVFWGLTVILVNVKIAPNKHAHYMYANINCKELFVTLSENMLPMEPWPFS